MQKLLALIFAAFFSFSAAAQKSENITCFILDTDTKRPLNGVSIIKPQGGVIAVTAADGSFDATASAGDTLILFLPGYKSRKFNVPDSLKTGIYSVTVFMETLYATTSRPIIVTPKKTLEDIEAERKKLGEIPRELQTPEISFLSPISALYELLSNRAMERKKLRKQMEADARRRIFYELFEYYADAGLFELPEQYYDDFIDYCNLPLEFIKYGTDYEITKVLLDKYNRYALVNGLIK